MDHSKMNMDMRHGSFSTTMMPQMDHSAMGQYAQKAWKTCRWQAAGRKRERRPATRHCLMPIFGISASRKTRASRREILVRLGGNMERYIWTINGKKYADSGPINLNYGERVRLKFVNDTMMAHPMHLHGMFVQLENGQPAEKLPNKHTVIVPPGQSYSVLLTADEAGEWAFHCHLLYHMMAGMMNKVIVAKLDPSAVPPVKKSDPHAGHKMPAKQEKPAVDHSTMDHSKMGHDMPAMDHSKMDHSGDKPANEGEQHHGH
jgi:FtsP/CotA-like multicopper oxidase with cupredoxin domain